MAEQAQQEPTMEEILSSIRKIIADDEPQTETENAAVSPGVVDAGASDDEAFEDLDFSLEEATEALPQTQDDVLDAISHIEEDTDVFESDTLDDQFIEETVAEAVEDKFEALVEREEPTFEPEPEPVSEPVFAEAPAEPEPTAMTEPVAKSEPIADAKTMDAAAGSLGKLLSKVEFGEEGGGHNTIEGVVREMLRPMLKEWLDDNLPAIVEKHVEAEVQRIARMAR